VLLPVHKSHDVFVTVVKTVINDEVCDGDEDGGEDGDEGRDGDEGLSSDRYLKTYHTCPINLPT
jgi:hypothetical protein